MPPIRALLYVALVATGLGFTAFVSSIERARNRLAGTRPPQDGAATRARWPNLRELGIGFLTDFLDTLGIGSFAPTTALFRFAKVVPDRLIPGTMMVGHALPTIAQSLIYITVIEVDIVTLVLVVAASAVGAWLGAGTVAKLDRRGVQGGMGIALLLAAAIMFMGLRGYFPAGGALLGLSGGKLAIGLVGNFVLGALMTIGIGAYAPSLIMFGLLGMNVKSIFPIMMSSCAFIMPAGGPRFVRAGSYAPAAALGLTLGGVPAVLIAAFVVRELPLEVVRWLVLVVVIFTAVSMLRSARRPKSAEATPETPT